MGISNSKSKKNLYYIKDGCDCRETVKTDKQCIAREHTCICALRYWHGKRHETIHCKSKIHVCICETSIQSIQACYHPKRSVCIASCRAEEHPCICRLIPKNNRNHSCRQKCLSIDDHPCICQRLYRYSEKTSICEGSKHKCICYLSSSECNAAVHEELK